MWPKHEFLLHLPPTRSAVPKVNMSNSVNPSGNVYAAMLKCTNETFAPSLKFSLMCVEPPSPPQWRFYKGSFTWKRIKTLILINPPHNPHKNVLTTTLPANFRHVWGRRKLRVCGAEILSSVQRFTDELQFILWHILWLNTSSPHLFLVCLLTSGCVAESEETIEWEYGKCGF